MTEVWLDTNVILRFLTREPPEQFRRAQRLMRRAQDGDLLLRLDHLVLAEAIWVLGSFYGRERREVADTLRSFMTAEGISMEDPDVALDALRLMADSDVAFVDAYVAATARRAGQPVATFDADFRRLSVDLVDLSA